MAAAADSWARFAEPEDVPVAPAEAAEPPEAVLDPEAALPVATAPDEPVGVADETVVEVCRQWV